MTAMPRSILRRAGARATHFVTPKGIGSLATTVLLSALAACGPAAVEIDRSAVEATDSESDGRERAAQAATVSPTARLRLSGEIAYDGPARASCGPTAPRADRSADDGPHVVGRLASPGEEPQIGEPAEEGEVSGHGAGAGFEITLEPLEADGFAVTLHLPSAGEVVDVPLVVAVVEADGGWRASRGVARVDLDSGSTLTRSVATHHVSGDFTGSYRGEAGSGELAGDLERCFYFD